MFKLHASKTTIILGVLLGSLSLIGFACGPLDIPATVQSQILDAIPDAHFVWGAPDVYLNANTVANVPVTISFAGNDTCAVDIYQLSPAGSVYTKRIVGVGGTTVTETLPGAFWYRLSPTRRLPSGMWRSFVKSEETSPSKTDSQVIFNPTSGAPSITIVMPGTMEH